MVVGNAVVLAVKVHPGYTVEAVAYYLGIKLGQFVLEVTKFLKTLVFRVS
jgi:hypothetical protein